MQLGEPAAKQVPRFFNQGFKVSQFGDSAFETLKR
jgi:hypothetical protein